MIDQAGIFSIDPLKIDIEGAEDLALTPFFRTAPTELLPRLVLIEDRPGEWSVNIYGLMQARGYVLDEQGDLRKHVFVFVDGRRAALGDTVRPESAIHVLQALTGG